MSLRMRKILEVLCFLLSCGVAVVLCCVRMSVYVGFVALLVLALFPGVPTFGWGRERLEFLQRTQQFRVGSRLMWILFLVVIVLGESFFTFTWGPPESRQWLMVNGGYIVFPALWNVIRSWAYVLYLFAPQKIRFREQMEEK